MILLHQVVQVLHRPQLTALGHSALALALELTNSLRISRVAVYLDHTWRDGVPSA
jgi:hypothetical protein